MKNPPQFPLLRLDPPKLADRKTRKAYVPSRKFAAAEQAARPVGQRMQRLVQHFAANQNPLELRADPAGLAPERLLVFELTGDIQNFVRTLANIPGLQFVGSEDIDGDDADKSPVLYLMISDAVALRQLTTLWQRWQSGAPLPEGFGPWSALFAQLRDVRVWGPTDRLSGEDLQVIEAEGVDQHGMVRLELELVYRLAGQQVEQQASLALQAAGGVLVSRTRIDGANYHALLVDVPVAELQNILARGNDGLVAAESVMHIRPQSAAHLTIFEPQEVPASEAEALPEGEPIAAIFDAVPLSAHPRLAGRLIVDDPFGLEAQAVGPRVHGTAMASAVVHGDLAGAAMVPLSRRVLFLNVMYAPPQEDEKFPDRLPADLFHEAVLRIKEGGNATGPNVVVVNASVGDRNKPFTGRMSGWARVVDYLSHRYGLLFVISAGNHLRELTSQGINTVQFEAQNAAERARTALRASAVDMANRRILAPSEAINALTVGALHSDNVPLAMPPALTFDVWHETGLCTVSSALGPGYGNSTKPDVLLPGGRHHVRLMPTAAGHRLVPMGKGAGGLGGILVAAPPGPADLNLDRISRTVGTSVAAALATGTAARAHEALEAVYDDFLNVPREQRALLLKAMLVHCARWTTARSILIEILGPSDSKLHVRQKDNVRRYLGYGAIDGQIVLDCATDRATLWGVGRLGKEQAHTLSIPLPVVMSGKAQPHEISITAAWFAPPRVGTASYRGVRLKLVEPDVGQATFAVKASGEQPDSNQTHRGTVIHRRWSGEKAAALAANSSFEVMLQRQPDDLDELTSYAVVATVTMPGVAEIYAQVRDRVVIKPKVLVAG